MKKITRGKILGLVILALSLGFAGCAKKPDFSANVTVEAYYQGEKIDPKTKEVMKDKDQKTIFEAKALSGPFKVLETSIKKTKEGTDLIDKITEKVVKQVTPIDKAKAVDKVSLALKVGDKIPNLAEKYEIRLADKVVPETPKTGTPEAIKKANEEAAKIRKENEDRKKFVFVGWFKDKDGKEPVNFDTRVTKGTKLVAIFAKPKVETNTVVSFRTESGVAPTHYEVASDDAIIARPVTIETIKEGTQAKPAYIMNNWLKASDGQPYDFSKSIKDNGGKDKVFPLVASWEKVQEGNVVVRFYTKQGVQNLPIQFKAGETLTQDKLPKDPDLEIEAGKRGNEKYVPASVSTQAPTYAKDAAGKLVKTPYTPKLFKHWSEEEDNTVKAYALNNKIKENLNLFAYWEARELTLRFSSETHQGIVTVKVPYGTAIPENKIGTSEEYASLTASKPTFEKFKEWTYKNEDGITGSIFEPGVTKLYTGANDIIDLKAQYTVDKFAPQTAKESSGVLNADGTASSVGIKYLVKTSKGIESSDNLKAPDLKIGETATLPETPKLDPTSQAAKEGYVFAGWSKNDRGTSSFDFDKKIENGDKLVAIWKKKPADASKVLVTYVTENGTAPTAEETSLNEKLQVDVVKTTKQVIKNGSVDSSSRYIFVGYKKANGEVYDPNKTLAENGGAEAMPLKADFEVVDENMVAVYYFNDKNFDSTSNTKPFEVKKVKVGEPIATVKPAYPVDTVKSATVFNEQYFKGWSSSRAGIVDYEFSTKAEKNKDVTLFANWKSAKFDIVFENDESTFNGENTVHTTVKNVLYGNTAASVKTDAANISLTSVKGENFLGWKTKTDGADFEVATAKIYETTTLIPKWSKTVYKITLDNGTLNASSDTVKGIIAKHDLADSEVTIIRSEKLKQLKWGDVLSSDYMSANPSSTYKPTTDGTNPNPNYLGIVFDGWRTEDNGAGDKVSFSGEKIADLTFVTDSSSTTENITKTKTLYASWKPKPEGVKILTINLNGKAAKVIDKVKNASEEARTFEIINGKNPKTVLDNLQITFDNYTFAGWSSDATGTGTFSDTANLTDDTTIYAKWTPNKYKVTFTSKVKKGYSNSTDFYSFNELMMKNVKADNEYALNDVEITYAPGKKLERPKNPVAPIPGHVLRWTAASECPTQPDFGTATQTSVAQDLKLFDFAKTVIEKNTNLIYCDLGFDPKEIVNQMVKVEPSKFKGSLKPFNKTGSYSYKMTPTKPNYDYYVFPYETTQEMLYKAMTNYAGEDLTAPWNNYTDDYWFAPARNYSYKNVQDYLEILNSAAKAGNPIRIDGIEYVFVVANKVEQIWAALAPEINNSSVDVEAGQAFSGANISGANKGDYVVQGNTFNAPKKVFPTRKPNNYGLFDMSGNVSEMVSDNAWSMGGSYENGSAIPDFNNFAIMPIKVGANGSGLLGFDDYSWLNNPKVGGAEGYTDEKSKKVGFRLYLVPSNQAGNRTKSTTPSAGN